MIDLFRMWSHEVGCGAKRGRKRSGAAGSDERECAMLCMCVRQRQRETMRWCRRILQLSPTALACLKAAINADEDGQAGLMELAGQVLQLSRIARALLMFLFCLAQMRWMHDRVWSSLESVMTWRGCKVTGMGVVGAGDAAVLSLRGREGGQERLHAATSSCLPIDSLVTSVAGIRAASPEIWPVRRRDCACRGRNQ